MSVHAVNIVIIVIIVVIAVFVNIINTANILLVLLKYALQSYTSITVSLRCTAFHRVPLIVLDVTLHDTRYTVHDTRYTIHGARHTISALTSPRHRHRT